MLYDQAQLLSVFSKASTALGNLSYKAVADEILQYCLRELYNPDKGAFMAAQDADSAPLAENALCKKGTLAPLHSSEGAFAMWTGKELRTNLTGEEYFCLSSEYDVSDEGNQLLFPGQVQQDRHWFPEYFEAEISPKRVDDKQGCRVKAIRGTEKAPVSFHRYQHYYLLEWYCLCL